ncbi:MAG TPA: hypothetical protein VG963_31325, partial [Polyangiaceae bacterium]|nr:hypothetical protein [Polyangiaceae bacterium]
MASPRPFSRRLIWASALWTGIGCSAAAQRDGAPPPLPTAGEPEGPVFFETPSASESTGPNGGVSGLVNGTDPTSDQSASMGPLDPARACATTEQAATLVKQPVDIIVILDNSGSMEDEAASVEANINVNFANVLTQSQVDYRVILISRHRVGPRDASATASTSVCVQVPLSGLASCDDAPQPVFSDRFFQYSTKIESNDSFDVALDTYAPPFDDSSRADKYDQAPNGWSAWLRPGAKKVFLEVTDDDSDLAAADFAQGLSALSPNDFGSDPTHPSFTFHSIVGLAEKDPPTAAYAPDEPVQDHKCTGNNGDVTNSGKTYQELSQLTGGLRFPLCQYDAYDVVFQRIAQDVTERRSITCDFPLPAAPGGAQLDLNDVALSYAPG